MRYLFAVPLILCGLTLTSCSRDDQPSARQAGRDAYRASQEAKHDARKAADDVRNASKDFREGWEEAKHRDPNPRRDRTDR